MKLITSTLLLLALLALAQTQIKREFCWRDSYGRGVGTIPNVCSSSQDKIELLCYPKCPAGYSRFGFDCHQNCPNGFTDTGLFCQIWDYGRGGGYPWQWGDTIFSLSGAHGRCNAANKQGCETWGAIVYPKCATGYVAAGCCLCSARPDCGGLGMNAGTFGNCAKKIIIGSPSSPGCGNKINQAGLCYDACTANYTGVGPVCWSQSPKGWVECGMGASPDSFTCAKITFSQVTSVINLAVNIATLGTSGAATTAASAAQKASKMKELYNSIKTLYDKGQDVRKLVDAAKKGAKTVSAANSLTDVFKSDQSKLTPEDYIRVSAQLVSLVDSSGVSSIISAYTHPLCSKITV